MLLEKFLNSGHPESIADNKSSNNLSLSDTGKSLVSNAQEFKNALLSSMQKNTNIEPIQVDSADIQSILSSEVITSANNNHTAENTKTDTVKENQVVEENLQQENTEISVVQVINKNITNGNGENMPTGGKVLPEHLLGTNRTSEQPPVAEILNNNVQVNVTSDNIQKTEMPTSNSEFIKVRTTAIAVDGSNNIAGKSTEEKNMDTNASRGKSDITVTKSDGEQSNKNSEKLLSGLQKQQIDMTKDNAGLVINKDLQTKIATAVRSLELPSVAQGNTSQKETKSLNVKHLIDSQQPAKPAFNSKTPEQLVRENISRLTEVNPVKEKNGVTSNVADVTTIPDSVKLALLQQTNAQSMPVNMKFDQLTEQTLLQSTRDEAASRVLSNAESSIQTVTKSLANTTAEVPFMQASPFNTSQSIHKPAEISLSVSTPAAQWNQKFAEHVSMLVLKGSTSAQIKLDPPELGPMAIRINHNGSETLVQFQVQNPIARELVDSGMHKLREMLEQHGFENVNVDVREQKEHAKNASDDNAEINEIDEQSEAVSTDTILVAEQVKNNTLVDIFA